MIGLFKLLMLPVLLAAVTLLGTLPAYGQLRTPGAGPASSGVRNSPAPSVRAGRVAERVSVPSARGNVRTPALPRTQGALAPSRAGSAQRAGTRVRRGPANMQRQPGIANPGATSRPLLGDAARRGSSGYPGSSARRHPGGGSYPFLNDLLQQQYGHDPYRTQSRAHRDYARAQRDAAIASAVVGIVGIIAESASQQPVHAVPAPSVSGPVYETMNVLVQEGYYEEQQVWVPEQHDRRTGVTIAGHYQTHKRWVPPVYETRQVRVR
jgi:hypothetical protein